MILKVRVANTPALLELSARLRQIPGIEQTQTTNRPQGANRSANFTEGPGNRSQQLMAPESECPARCPTFRGNRLWPPNQETQMSTWQL